MKKTAYFIGGIVLYIGMALVFSSYGNVVAHRNINEGIIEKFKTRFVGSPKTGKFKNYKFLYNSSVGYEGQMITRGGKLYVTEETKSLSMQEWIIEGGFSADEPQLAASLRHFYDPTIKDPDKRYLEDLVDKIEDAIEFDFNPKIDHITWATRELEHTYNWLLGKSNLKKALETSDVKDRRTYMAFAWRSLGETLHMIADMGCPAHVRDDAHPGLFDDYSILKEFGDSDPYENICEQLTGQMIAWSKGAVDESLKKKLDTAKTVQDIAHELAVYTNKNYFTDQTISGRNVVQRIHPEKTYPSPKIEDCIYDPATHSYTKMISGHKVIMCRDKSYAMPQNARIDRVSVESQAAALMPQIAEAGANVIRLFIPDLEIVIEELTENSIKGSVKHTTDEEYKNAIKYDGEIELLSENSKGLGVIECIDGKFDTSHNISSNDIDWSDEGLEAQIHFGGVTVKSPVKRMSEIDFHPPLVRLMLSGDWIGEGIQIDVRNENRDAYLSGDTANYPGLLKWDGLSFSADWVIETYTEHENGWDRVTKSGVFYGEISPDFSTVDMYGKTIHKAIGHTSWIEDNSGIIYTSELEIRNVPISQRDLIYATHPYVLSRNLYPIPTDCIVSARYKHEWMQDGVFLVHRDDVLQDLNHPSLSLYLNFGYWGIVMPGK